MKKITSVPDAARTFEALRSLGYDLNSSVADLVDNCITKKVGAKSVVVTFLRNKKFHLSIQDDGCGMTKRELEEAMRIGTRTHYKDEDLGKFGMGMKTASISHCNVLTVISKKKNCQVAGFRWDLNHVNNSTDGWVLFELEIDEIATLLKREKITFIESGTLVLWTDCFNLDNEFESYHNETLANNYIFRKEEELKLYLSMIFHRFLEKKKLKITVNQKLLKPWDPFCREEEETHELNLSEKLSEFRLTDQQKPVLIKAFILPNKESFSSEDAWKRGKGLLSWNESQGYYIYRADRIIRFGGWHGTRALDEHDKLARISIDIHPQLDRYFRITVNKAKIKLPDLLFHHLKNHVNPLVSAKAKKQYKRTAVEFKNKFRKQTDKLEGIGKAFVEENGISTKSAEKNVYLVNPNGTSLSNQISEFLNYGSSKDFEVVSGKIQSGHLWKVLCNDKQKFKVIINEDHPFYNKIYNSSLNKNATNAIDALLCSLAFGELYNRSVNNAQLFDTFKTVSAKTLEKIIKEDVL